MELYIHTTKSQHLPYEEIREAFAKFQFTEDLYEGKGSCIRQHTGRSRYGVIHIVMQRDFGRFIWDVSEEKIPSVYIDAVLSTIKNIINIPKGLSPFSSFSFNYKVIDGAYHPVDSDNVSYEIATFLAIAAIIGFDHETLNIYRKNKL
ncbi:hypothetical protein [Flavobacterium cerinum]|uniref:Uncharacterized protein n=1 Tax=Flavobacterium cerinum TaxID=2502784 RepID=A0ABY5IWT0_9FLAO|nr:hypothetical protein [Flavobacterium cerinum]UUC47296.1 hypothetical protein NOX80_08865 [Flavobacterium cerinum]